MNRDDICSTLRAHMPYLRDTYHVSTLQLFGSYARDEATPQSDIDLLVEFGQTRSLVAPDGLMGLIEYLEDLFGTDVDLATPDMLRPRLRRHIESEVFRVA